MVLVGGTATLIWALVKRGASRDGTGAAPAAATPTLPEQADVALPAGAEVQAATLAGRGELVLLGRAPAEGQFVLVVDAATGERLRLLRLVAGPR